MIQNNNNKGANSQASSDYLNAENTNKNFTLFRKY
jgi:hypothetical protein